MKLFLVALAFATLITSSLSVDVREIIMRSCGDDQHFHSLLCRAIQELVEDRHGQRYYYYCTTLSMYQACSVDLPRRSRTTS